MIVFSDPHLGVRRHQNTTPASRQRLQDIGFEAVEGILDLADNEPVVCGGDLFDSYSNPESVIKRVAPLAARIDWCLTGNHDVMNAAERVSSLQLLRELIPQGEDRFCFNAFGNNDVHTRTFGNKILMAVPHVCDQESFEYALAEAYSEASSAPADHHKYLLLHCNYDNPFTDETSLNLTQENARELLEVFDYVLLGHEHQPREDLGGRLVIIGSPTPTSFSDISDKRVIRIQEDGSLSSIRVWGERQRSWKGDWDKAEEQLPARTDELQFLRLTGKAEPGQLVDLGKLVRKLWAELPGLLCLKVEVEVAGAAKPSLERAELSRLPEKIAAELKGTDLEDLWKELTNPIDAKETV